MPIPEILSPAETRYNHMKTEDLTMNYYLGADIGTSGTKTVLFDVKGTVIASATEEYPLYQPQNGYAEQDPQDWANAVLHTMAAVLE